MIDIEVLNRAALALGIILSGWGLFLLYNRIINWRNSGHAHEDVLQGRSVLLYFTLPTCIPCKTVQRPAIEQVKATLAERIEVVIVDVMEQPNFARSWGVFSVPTTYVIDPRGKVRHVNHGVTRAEKLIEQLQGL
jgi:thioredoxin-like negative regulator of GroEL